MKERPILMNSEMVTATLLGRKTQTRRAIKHPALVTQQHNGSQDPMLLSKCPYGKVGDQLWVRERWATTNLSNKIKPSDLPENKRIYYAQNFDEVCEAEKAIDGCVPLVTKWRPSIFMCRWMSRIQLEITDIRVERLNDISEEECVHEGVKAEVNGVWIKPDPTGVAQIDWHRKLFKRLWESINGKGSWNENPWVWVIEFKRVVS